MPTAFTSSDLANRRKMVLAAAKAGRALVRDTDGTTLVMLPAEHLATRQRLSELDGVLRALVASLQAPDPSASSLGEIAWVATWPYERRQRLVSDLAEVLTLAHSLQDPMPADAFLEASKPRHLSTSPKFDAADAFASLTDEDRAILEGKRRPAKKH